MEASPDHGHLELHLDYADVGREGWDRASPILVPCNGTQHRWIVGKLMSGVIMSGVQTLVVKSDQEVSIVDCDVHKMNFTNSKT